MINGLTVGGFNVRFHLWYVLLEQAGELWTLKVTRILSNFRIFYPFYLCRVLGKYSVHG